MNKPQITTQIITGIGGILVGTAIVAAATVSTSYSSIQITPEAKAIIVEDAKLLKMSQRDTVSYLVKEAPKPIHITWDPNLFASSTVMIFKEELINYEVLHDTSNFTLEKMYSENAPNTGSYGTTTLVGSKEIITISCKDCKPLRLGFEELQNRYK